MAQLTEVTKADFEAQVLKADKVALVYYNAPWCKQGQKMLETVQAAAEEVGDKMLFFSVDTDKEDVIVVKQGVMTVPTVHFVTGGQRVDELRGTVSELDLLGKVSNILSGQEETKSATKGGTSDGDASDVKAPAESGDPPADPA